MTKRIQISEKVFAAIWQLSSPDLTNENDILDYVLSSMPEYKDVLQVIKKQSRVKRTHKARLSGAPSMTTSQQDMRGG